MKKPVDTLIESLEKLDFVPNINLDRPRFIQPEDRIQYRAFRILLILGSLNKKKGLSKTVVASVDFLLRNPGFQKKFILEYFKGQKNLSIKLSSFCPKERVEYDYYLVPYRSIPWDLRFNDFFLFLHIRNLILFRGKKPNLRVLISEAGNQILEQFRDVFVDELNFMEIFGVSISEKKLIDIITNIIPNSYWKENEEAIH